MPASQSFFPLVRQTTRRLVRERGFTTTVLLTLALCIGANVAMFAVIDAILLRSLPFQHADRLVSVMNSYPGAGAPRIGASLPNYYERREGGVEAFESVAIRQGGSAILGEAGSPIRVPRDRVSPEFFETIGFPLLMGQTFTEEQMLYENSSVLIATYEFWQDEFGGDPNVLGRELMIDSLPHRVVGVLSPGFKYLNSEARFFAPLASSLEEREANRRHSNNVQMIAHLEEGVSVEAAQDAMNRFNDRVMENDPFADMVRDAGFHTLVVDLHDEVVRETKPILIILQAAAMLLLVIGCVNLVNLLLIRSKGRAKEIAVRQSLGAGRRHLARETLCETVLISVLGGIAGIGVGAVGIRLLTTLGAEQLPLGSSITLDGRVALVSLLGAALVGVCLAVPIVVMHAKKNLAPALQAESRTGTLSRSAHAARMTFIVVQIGLAFALLSAAGLLGLSLNRVLSNSPGFKPEHVTTASISLPWKNYQEAEGRQAFMEKLLERLKAQPGIDSVGLTSALPFTGHISNNATVVEGYERQPGDSIRAHYVGFAMGDYWKAMSIPLVEGRVLEKADQVEGNRVCVVDTDMAERYWPGDSAVGKRIAVDVELTDENAITIVGVVGTIKQTDLAEDGNQGMIYMPFRLRNESHFFLAVKSSLAPDLISNAMRNKVLELDPELPLDNIRVMQDRIDDSLLARRSPAMLAGVFAVVALLLAAIGTYGVLAYAVGERTREIGVRMAIGAQPGQVLQQFLSLGGKLFVGGMLLGMGGAWVFGIGMQSVLYEVVPFHVGIVLVTAAVLGFVVFTASYLPSNRASRVSPLEAMRGD